jgi:translation initiation factor 5
LYKDKLLAKVPNILKAFYDHDILDEEALFEWADKPSKKYVSKDVSKLIREKASAFIQWLKEAEVEEESSDEANKKPQATNGSAKATNGQQKNKANNHNHVEEDDDDESDVEIEYSHRVSGIKVETIKPVNNDAANGAKDEADDLNIDDI